MENITQEELNKYTQRQNELTTEVENLNRQVIIAEQEVKQSQQYFQENFGTTDPSELEKIKNDYKTQLITLEEQLNTFETQLSEQ